MSNSDSMTQRQLIRFFKSPRAAILAIGIMLIILSLPIWLVHHLPLNDYPSHLLEIHILKEYHNPTFNFSQYLTVNWKPFPVIGSEIIILGLSYIVPIEIAGKIYLNLMGILLVASIFYFLHAVDPRKTFLGVFGFLWIYNWYFHQGYLNFYGSLSLYFFGLGYWLRAGDLDTVSKKAIFGALCLTTYFFHLYTWLALVGTVTTISIFRSDRWKRLRRIVVALVPNLLLFAHYMLTMPPISSTRRIGALTDPINSITFAITHTVMNFTRWEPLIYAIPILLLLLFAGHAIFLDWRNRSATEKAIFGAICVLTLFFFVTPMQFGSVWPFNLRVNIFLIILPLALVSVAFVRRWKAIIVSAVALTSLVIAADVFVHYRIANGEIEDYLSGIPYVEQNSTILPLTFAAQNNFTGLAPMGHIWAYYHLKKAGIGPYFYHDHLIDYRVDPKLQFPAPDPYPVVNPDDFDPAIHGQLYDYVIVYGSDASLARKLSGNFDVVYTKPPLSVYRKRDSAAVSQSMTPKK